MLASSIAGPFLSMMVLTFVVWIVMYQRRIRYIVANSVDPQQLSSPDRAAAMLPENVRAPADNLRNLFELPVLFYVLCLYLYLSSSIDAGHMIAAWLFVATRILHSYVHCTSNRVMLRFKLYVASSLALWFMLARAVAEVVLL